MKFFVQPITAGSSYELALSVLAKTGSDDPQYHYRLVLSLPILAKNRQ
jgi:hypothetical protein